MTRSDEPTLSGWGRLTAPGREHAPENLEAATEGAVLTRGLGRSYGDSSLPPPGTPEVAGSRRADRILWFEPEPETGPDAGPGAGPGGRALLRAEAGLSLDTIYRLFLPRGWFVPVTPGTRFVTLGGMVAADVHGKNHHRDGTIGRHVRALRLRLASGEVVECSRAAEPDLFRATLGGMGLTGHILEVELEMVRVPSPWIWAESFPVPSVERFVEELDAAAASWPFTVGWIDCLAGGAATGRGVLTRGRWASPDEAPEEPPRPKRRLGVPFVAPGFLLGRWSVRVFNAIYFHRTRLWTGGTRRGVVHPEPFFYPLDAIRHWNRLYGPRGFTQYQCVLPKGASAAETAARARRVLDVLTGWTGSGAASFLCVIKDCGAEGEGVLSFPKPGISLAVDLPVRDSTPELVDALDRQVIAEGGRIYLAKDAFTRPERFAAMEGERLEELRRLRQKYDPEGKIRSAQSVRLLGR